MKVYADIFKALADETRLIIFSLLLNYDELCVCDVEGILQISQSKASRHLRYLKNAGLVDDRREGLWVYYKVANRSKNPSAAVIAVTGELIASLVDDKLKARVTTWFEKEKNIGSTCEVTAKGRC